MNQASCTFQFPRFDGKIDVLIPVMSSSGTPNSIINQSTGLGRCRRRNTNRCSLYTVPRLKTTACKLRANTWAIRAVFCTSTPVDFLGSHQPAKDGEQLEAVRSTRKYWEWCADEFGPTPQHMRLI